MEFLNALFTAALDNNLVFVQLVGMASVMVLALRPEESVRFGLGLWGATAVSGILGWPLYYLLLQPWGISYLGPIVYLMVASAVVFLVGGMLAAKKPLEERRDAMVICTAIALNACLLACPLSIAEADCTFDVGAGTAIGAGLGAFIAVVLFATLRERVNDAQVPAALRGLPISVLTAALMALAFVGINGAVSGLFV